MATMNISLPDAMKAWVEEQTKDGRYANSSDYLRDLIRRDLEQQREDAWLIAEAEIGLASGPARPYDPDAFLADLKTKYAGRFRP